jgi:succinate-semialdehyde dehydrogenase/glutarate-semialdehyde dehydrogenase
MSSRPAPSLRHGSPIATVNPATGELVREFGPMSDEHVDHAVDAAHEAFLSWREVPVSERAAMLGRVADLLTSRVDLFASLVTLEMGKLQREAVEEVHLSAKILRYYMAHAERQLAAEPIDVPNGTATIEHAPLGVVLGVMPWNYPVYQVTRFAAPTLAAGNVVLLKHASQCPQTAIAIERMFADAGAPPGVYSNLLVPGPAVGRVIEHPLVRGVSLTGSEGAGASVAEIAGRHLKKCVLELGGNDPFIVLDGDDLQRTIAAAAEARMSNTGQSCIAAKRFIVIDEAYEAFVHGLCDHLSALTPGDPTDGSTTLAPLSSEAAVAELSKRVDRAVAQGARLALGGERIDRPGAYFQPTVLTSDPPPSDAFDEELFGPVAQVFRVDSDEAAIQVANNTRYGLGGAVF